MNVIIVSRSLRTPRKFSLREPRIIALAAGVLLALLTLGFGAGFLSRGAGGAARAELSRLREQFGQQHAQIEQTRQHTQREINAMASRLAELQAQTGRLNALGEHLTRVAKLEDGEFDFSEQPGLGGVEPAEFQTDAGLGAGIEQLATELARSGAQLDLLEAMLTDREIDQSLTPTGYPIRTGYMSSSFGYRVDPFTGGRQFHRGIDFSGPGGSDVLAVADGVVVYSGKHAGYGNMVDIDHGNGYLTRYGHNRENLVRIGERVRAGQPIAKLGTTGRSTGNHVHIEVWRDGRPINPYQFIKSRRG